jgi:hypothetical protein
MRQTKAMIAAGLAALAAAGVTAVATASGASQATIASTKTVTVYRNSPTCVQGYKVAGQALLVVGQAVRDASAYPPLVYKAAEAGLKQDTAEIRKIAGQMTVINGQLATAAHKINALDATLHPSSTGCN